MKLKFLVDAFVNGKVVYEKGKVYEIDNSLGSADRWLRRGVAEVVVEMMPVKEETSQEEPKAKGSSKKKKTDEELL